MQLQFLSSALGRVPFIQEQYFWPTDTQTELLTKLLFGK
jgi:hypothetical protein